MSLETYSIGYKQHNWAKKACFPLFFSSDQWERGDTKL